MPLQYSSRHKGYYFYRSCSAPKEYRLTRHLFSNRSVLHLCALVSLTELHVESELRVGGAAFQFDWDLCFLCPPAALLLGLQRSYSTAKPKYALGALGLVAAIGGYLVYRLYSTRDDERVEPNKDVAAHSCAPVSEESASLKDVCCLATPSEEDKLYVEATLVTGNSNTPQLSPPCQRILISSDTIETDKDHSPPDNGSNRLRVPRYGNRKRSANTSTRAQAFDPNSIPDEYPLAKKLLLEHQAVGRNMVDSGYVQSEVSSVYGNIEEGRLDESEIFSQESDDGIVKDEVVAESSLVKLGEEAGGLSRSERGASPRLARHQSENLLKSQSCNCSPKHDPRIIDFSRADLCNSMLKLRGDQLEGIGADLVDILKQLTSLQSDITCVTTPDRRFSGSENSLHLLRLPADSNAVLDVFHSSVHETSGYMPGWTPMGKFVVTKEFKIKHLYCLPECADEVTSMMTAFIGSVLAACPERLIDSQITMENILTKIETASKCSTPGHGLHQQHLIESFYSQLSDLRRLPLLDQLISLSSDSSFINQASKLARLVMQSFDLDCSQDKSTPSFYMACQIGGETVKEQMLVHTLAHILEIDLLVIRPTFVHTNDISLLFEHKGAAGKQAILIQQFDDSYHIPLVSSW